MSTRGYICRETEPGKYEGIYVHSDSYLTHNGAILLDHYSDPQTVYELLSLGDLSVLAPDIYPDPEKGEHSFDFGKRQDGVCIAYHRDRGEELSPAKEVTLDKLKESWAEYAYFYTLGGEWKYVDVAELEEGNTEFRDVKADLDKQFEKWGIERPENVYGFYPDEYIKQLKAEQELEKDKSIEMGG